MNRAGSAAAAAALLWWAPTVAAAHPVRRHVTARAFPRFHGIGDSTHVALTYDDGPDRVSTPRFLDLLGEHHVRATFFLLGEHAVLEQDLVKRMADEGHELAVHGWTHRCVAAMGPRRLTADLTRTKHVLEQAGGRPVRWYRPPYGVATTPALVAARRAGLSPVLWSAWGVDWRRGRTPRDVVDTLVRDLRPGGTILLHDTDRTSTPGSWETTLSATRILLEGLARTHARTGPLAEHWTHPRTRRATGT